MINLLTTKTCGTKLPNYYLNKLQNNICYANKSQKSINENVNFHYFNVVSKFRMNLA